MRRISNTFTLFFVALAGAASSACTSGGVGDPCVPEDEYNKDFPGYQPTETNVESQSFQCETRVCLVTYFRGRVSCPYGNQTGQNCYLPGTKADPGNTDAIIRAKVDPWIQTSPAATAGRKPEQAVYCSCRCDGPDQAARYCQCPSGFVCQKLVDDIGKGHAQLAGSYCVKEGSQVTNPTALRNSGTPCQLGPPASCGPQYPEAL
jgi:hypothetical protein